MDTRTLAVWLARTRIVVGAGLLLAPDRAGRTWLGAGAGTRPAHLLARTTGMRDLALGAGASIALGERRGGANWVSIGALCDLVDAAACLLTPGLPKRARLVGLTALAAGLTQLRLSRELATTEAPTAD